MPTIPPPSTAAIGQRIKQLPDKHRDHVIGLVKARTVETGRKMADWTDDDRTHVNNWLRETETKAKGEQATPEDPRYNNLTDPEKTVAQLLAAAEGYDPWPVDAAFQQNPDHATATADMIYDTIAECETEITAINRDALDLAYTGGNGIDYQDYYKAQILCAMGGNGIDYQDYYKAQILCAINFPDGTYADGLRWVAEQAGPPDEPEASVTPITPPDTGGDLAEAVQELTDTIAALDDVVAPAIQAARDALVTVQLAASLATTNKGN